MHRDYVTREQRIGQEYEWSVGRFNTVCLCVLIVMCIYMVTYL